MRTRRRAARAFALVGCLLLLCCAAASRHTLSPNDDKTLDINVPEKDSRQ
jgi:hypothetical protein